MNNDNRVKLSVLGFSFSQKNEHGYGLVLAEDNGNRRLMIVIGSPEAQSIAFCLQQTHPPRPLTHDVFSSTLLAFNIELIEVNIYKFDKGVFYAEMLFKQGDLIIKIESRTSDAVALALRLNTPIYTSEELIAKVGVTMSDSNEPSSKKFIEEVNEYSLDYSLLNKSELEVLLKNAISLEDYELASVIRDELKKRD